MFRAVGRMVATVGMGEMRCLSAIPAVAISGRCGVVSTFGPGVGRVGKGRIGMGLGGRSS